MRSGRRLVVLSVLLLALAAAAPAWAQATPTGPAYVTRVVDGDTMYAELGGRIEVVRYLGVNAPRIEHPTRGSEVYAVAAREANRRLVEGRWIYLVFEGQPRDRFGRLQAYVWVGDVLANAALVHHGYGEATATATAALYGDYFRGLEAAARQDGRGLWRDPDARTYHRPRPPEGAPGAAEYEERAADASGGRVFSAPAPFLPPTTPAPSSAGIAVPTAPRAPAPVPLPPSAPRASPSYIPPRGATTPTR